MTIEECKKYFDSLDGTISTPGKPIKTLPYKEIYECRFCGSKDLWTFLDLGMMPLVNNLLNTKDEVHELYPLAVKNCRNCLMSQLSISIDPNVLYKNYLYRSEMSKEFKVHCEELSKEIVYKHLPTDAFVIDIASNDGTFLKTLKEKNDDIYALDMWHACDSLKVLGVDPAENLCKIAESKGIATCNRLFDYETALNIRASDGEADVITVQNCFAHVNDIWNFMHGIKQLLKPEGTFIVEVPWAGDLVENCLFGQCYHEHLSYITVKGMYLFLEKFDMHIENIKYFTSIHGGSIRFYIKHGRKYGDVSNLFTLHNCISREDFLFRLDNLMGVSYRAGKGRIDLDYHEMKNFVGVGAAAKGTILANFYNLKDRMKVIYDSTPEKHFKYQPGTRIEIRPFEELKDESRDILILPDNWKNEIYKNIRKINQKSKIVVVVPNYEVMNGI